MVNPNQLAEIAAVVGEPARAVMLTLLMDGRALTATELACGSGITPPTASSHLARLVSAQLVIVEKQGRHRYHRLANREVAQMLEGMMQIASHQAALKPALRVGPRDKAMRTARTCYDHLAGRLGVAISDALVRRGLVDLEDDAARVTEEGAKVLNGIGIITIQNAGGRLTRPLCRPCLDWSERRAHLAGRLGAAICSHCLRLDWVRYMKGTRALTITPKGHCEMRAVFGIEPLN
jgi:DNA-binding transcriptional ArsR family regulator